MSGNKASIFIGICCSRPVFRRAIWRCAWQSMFSAHAPSDIRHVNVALSWPIAPSWPLSSPDSPGACTGEPPSPEGDGLANPLAGTLKLTGGCRWPQTCHPFRSFCSRYRTLISTRRFPASTTPSRVGTSSSRSPRPATEMEDSLIPRCASTARTRAARCKDSLSLNSRPRARPRRRVDAGAAGPFDHLPHRGRAARRAQGVDRKSTRLNSSHT